MIEDKIQQLIEALNANTDALLKQGRINATITTQPIKWIDSEPATTPLPFTPLTPVATPAVAVIDDTLAKIEKLKADQAAQKAVEQAAKPAAPAITLESLTELALKVVSLGPTAAKRIKALNESHGIEKITKCPPDKFQAVWDSLIELRKELGGVE